MLCQGLQRHTGSHEPVFGWEVLLFLQPIVVWNSGTAQLLDCGKVWFLRLDQHRPISKQTLRSFQSDSMSQSSSRVRQCRKTSFWRSGMAVTTCISAALQVKCHVETKNFFLCGLKATVSYQMCFALPRLSPENYTGQTLIKDLSFELRQFQNLQTICNCQHQVH